MNLTTTRSAKFTNTIVVEGSGSIARMIRKVSLYYYVTVSSVTKFQQLNFRWPLALKILMSKHQNCSIQRIAFQVYWWRNDHANNYVIFRCLSGRQELQKCCYVLRRWNFKLVTLLYGEHLSDWLILLSNQHPVESPYELVLQYLFYFHLILIEWKSFFGPRLKSSCSNFVAPIRFLRMIDLGFKYVRL